MIVKLNKNKATTEGIFTYILYYSEDRFNIYPDRREKEKVKFMSTKYDKDLDFLDTLKLHVQWHWDALIWYKKQ